MIHINYYNYWSNINKKEITNITLFYAMSPSSQYHFILCLFLLSFLSLNSQSSLHDSYIVFIKNDSPSILEAKCLIKGAYDRVVNRELKPGMKDGFFEPVLRDKENYICCNMTLGEKYRGLYYLYDLYDIVTCHSTTEECNWIIHEEGMCMLLNGECNLTPWYIDIRNISSESMKL